MAFFDENLRLLLIEDDEDDYLIARHQLRRVLQAGGTLDWEKNADRAIEALCGKGYDVALLDYRLGARTGLDVLREVVSEGCRTPVILLTGQTDRELDLEALEAGATDYLVKGAIDAETLERSIRYALARKRAEDRIRQQADLLDKARDAILNLDLAGNLVYWNASAERLFGFTTDEMREGAFSAFLRDVATDAGQLAWDTALAEGSWQGEMTYPLRDGREITAEVRVTLVRDAAAAARSMLVFLTDISERKQLETQFLRSQRMESIGNLVGGIAHDLGNLLVPIQLGVKVLQARHSDHPKSARTLEMMRKSSERGSAMVKQVLSFARGVEGDRAPLRVEDVLHEVEKLTSETFPADLRVSLTIEDDLAPVVGDATQVQQVLMNLCVNARDAMEDVGRLAIVAGNVDVTDTMATMSVESQPGHYVTIAVSDSGPGIPPEVQTKLFEPFFTTKAFGKGTGLGLSTVYSIVKSHGGFVTVYSEMGHGTTFRIYLPAAEGAAEPVVRDGEQADLPRADGERVLLVDDEEWVREATREALEQVGYSVTTAVDGNDALAIFEQREGRFDAIVTDIMMPGMDGIELIRRIKKQRPKTPIIAASGLSSERGQAATDAGAAVALAKPYRFERLATALHEQIHGTG